MPPDFTFRFRLKVPSSQRMSSADSTVSFEMPGAARPVRLTPHAGPMAVRDATEFVIESSGWGSEDAAWSAGGRCQTALSVTFAHVGLEADFGRRMPRGFFTAAYLEKVNGETGQRFMNDMPELMVFETHPTPTFVRFQATAHSAMAWERVAQVLAATFASDRSLSASEALALDLLHAAGFETSCEAKLVLLIAAVEALLQHRPKKESIRQAGRRLATERLGGKVYDGKTAAAFFNRCYPLRSELVHGSAPPGREIAAVLLHLRKFVSDLLTG